MVTVYRWVRAYSDDRIFQLLGEPKVLLGSLALVLRNRPTGRSTHLVTKTMFQPVEKAQAALALPRILPDFKMGNEAARIQRNRGSAIAKSIATPACRCKVVSQATEPPKPQIRRGLYDSSGIGCWRYSPCTGSRAGRQPRTADSRGRATAEFRCQVIAPGTVALEFAGGSMKCDCLSTRTLAKHAPLLRRRVATAAIPATQRSSPRAFHRRPQCPSRRVGVAAPAGPVPVPATAPGRLPAMDSRQQTEFLARRQEARHGGDKMSTASRRTHSPNRIQCFLRNT